MNVMHEFGFPTAQHIREILQMLQGSFTNYFVGPGNKASRGTEVFFVVTNYKTS